MEMSSRRKLVGPDCEGVLLVLVFGVGWWWEWCGCLGLGQWGWTDDLDRARFVVVVGVCGPAAAVEGAEERAHFGSQRGRVVAVGHLPFDDGGGGVGREEQEDSLCVPRRRNALFSSFFLLRWPPEQLSETALR